MILRHCPPRFWVELDAIEWIAAAARGSRYVLSDDWGTDRARIH